MTLRNTRGADVVRDLGVDPTDARGIIDGCSRIAAKTLGIPRPEVETSTTPSRAKVAAKGRYLAGTITLFPPAFADPLTLAWTVLHEVGHASGLNERAADAFAARFLSGKKV